ncbi:MAG: DivIVA domain-containing protein [Mycobacterium sp.]
MPLTPADVHNVAFSKPPIGKRGYNEDEVDAFLDLVETELARLIEENADLRQRVGELDAELASARGGVTAVPMVRAEPVVEQVVETTTLGEDQALKAARVLSLAQDTADRLTNTAITESENMLADARAQAEQIVSEARYLADTTVTDAQERADAMLADAQTRSEAQLRAAQEKADILQNDAERKHTELMNTINQQRTLLEGRLEQLRTFEREYRTRLKTYLESQLEELGQRGSAAPTDTGDVGYTQYQ